MLTGGVAPERLLDAGALRVHANAAELRDQVDSLLGHFARDSEAGG